MSTPTLDEHRDGATMIETTAGEKDLEKHGSDVAAAAQATSPNKAAPAPAAGPPPLHLPRAAYLSLVGGWIALFFGFG
jgi:hypothetical protein